MAQPIEKRFLINPLTTKNTIYRDSLTLRSITAKIFFLVSTEVILKAFFIKEDAPYCLNRIVCCVLFRFSLNQLKNIFCRASCTYCKLKCYKNQSRAMPIQTFKFTFPKYCYFNTAKVFTVMTIFNRNYRPAWGNLIYFSILKSGILIRHNIFVKVR